jgi:hairy and enhancer of split, invertebrate
MSRSFQYRKVMKPLIEKKRRARINKCLDDLRDLMVFALQTEGESVARLEKADVLELTVRHLQKLKRQRQLEANPSLDVDRFSAGYSSCAAEVSKFLASVPGVEIGMGTQMMSHLGQQLSSIRRQSVAPLSVVCQTRPPVSMSPSSDGGYSSDSSLSPSPSPAAPSAPVWRPF